MRMRREGLLYLQIHLTIFMREIRVMYSMFWRYERGEEWGTETEESLG